MIVEPTPVHSPSPLRRLARAGAMLAPVALLVAVVTAGLLGPKPATAAGRLSPPHSTETAAPSAEAPGPSAGLPGPSALPALSADGPGPEPAWTAGRLSPPPSETVTPALSLLGGP